MSSTRWRGPEQTEPAHMHNLAPGVWLTSGRAALLEGPKDLVIIDPGDEEAGTAENPQGVLADILHVTREVGKPIGLILVTHAHPDHVRNLPLIQQCFPRSRVIAHAGSPLDVDYPIYDDQELRELPGMRVLVTPGHAHWGDDLCYFFSPQQILFSGDLVQPKGETWENAFYPSPYPFFRDGDQYLESLAKLMPLRFTTLVTGHREVRRGEDARRWLQLTHLATARVEKAVYSWSESVPLAEAAPQIWDNLAQERGIPLTIRVARRNGGDQSAFSQFDLPGIRYYWNKYRETPQ